MYEKQESEVLGSLFRDDVLMKYDIGKDRARDKHGKLVVWCYSCGFFYIFLGSKHGFCFAVIDVIDVIVNTLRYHFCCCISK